VVADLDADAVALGIDDQESDAADASDADLLGAVGTP
jgi:hypothetical protein